MAKISKKLTGLVLGTAFAAMAGLAANDAMALEVGDCKSGSEITNALQAEGQVQIFTGLRASGYAQKNYFTSNSQMDLGYNLEKSEAPDGKICVTAKYTGIRLYNDPSVAIPESAKIAPEDSPFNQYLVSQTQPSNGRVIFAAIALTKDSNGIERPTSKIIVTQEPHNLFGTAGVMAAGFPNGGFATANGLTNITLTSNYSKLASNPSVLLASNTQQPK